MGRKPRIIVKNGLYYTSSKAAPEEGLFRDAEDYAQYAEFLEKYRKQYEYTIYSYQIFSDQVYLLLQTAGDATISDIMHAINSTYTKYYNSKYERADQVFKGRYVSVLIEKPVYIGNIINYIEYLPTLLKKTSGFDRDRALVEVGSE